MKTIKDIFMIGAVTIFLLLLIEGILRITGTGFPAKFLIEKELNGEKKLINNVNYTIPFFSERLVRTPMPFAMDQTKKEGTIRIFIAGESAIMGDPDYSFGAGRILEVILKEQFPGKNFEIINTAITAVNSNVILPIVRECANHDPDLFIFYIGNNEVIGPFGPTSVFLPFLESPSLIRLSIALNATRMGQIARKTGQKLAKPGNLPAKWEGMEMYLEHQLAWDDPQLAGVYRVYHDNLKKMCRSATRKHANVILCTVASNLRDCAPFGSSDTPANNGDAEFWFTKGNEYLEAGDADKAYDCFIKSRDYDLLRFRCDSKINDITRNMPAELKSSKIHLLDFEKEIRSSAEQGIPGYDLFYEHVHFNFTGNYLLARELSESVKKALSITSAIPVPSQEYCKNRLAFNRFEESEIWRDVLLRYQKAPFIRQMSHEKDLYRLNEIIRPLTDSSNTPEQMELTYTSALQTGNDWLIRYNYALFLMNNFTDRRPQTIRILSEIREQIPHLSSLHFNLGYVYQLQENYGLARENYARALDLHPGYSQVYEELGKICIVEEKYNEARENFKKAGIGNERIADIFATMASGYAKINKSDRVLDLLDLCLEYNKDHFDANFSMGGYHLRNKSYEQSALFFERCTVLKPAHADSYYFLGRSFEGSRRFMEAEDAYKRCLELIPENKRYHNSHGKVQFLLRKFPGAIQSFSRAIELDPRFYEAYVNLADSYMAMNNLVDARKTMNRLVPEDISDPAILKRMALEFTRLNDSRSAAKCNVLAAKYSAK